MSDWNPALYMHFAAERLRPATELLARIPLENVWQIADIGCGPGNSSALLYQRWPAARITGIDSSPAMIAEVRLKHALKGVSLKVFGQHFCLRLFT